MHIKSVGWILLLIIGATGCDSGKVVYKAKDNADVKTIAITRVNGIPVAQHFTRDKYLYEDVRALYAPFESGGYSGGVALAGTGAAGAVLGGIGLAVGVGMMVADGVADKNDRDFTAQLRGSKITMLYEPQIQRETEKRLKAFGYVTKNLAPLSVEQDALESSNDGPPQRKLATLFKMPPGKDLKALALSSGTDLVLVVNCEAVGVFEREEKDKLAFYPFAVVRFLAYRKDKDKAVLRINQVAYTNGPLKDIHTREALIANTKLVSDSYSKAVDDAVAEVIEDFKPEAPAKGKD
jgi:hypothetical protein